MTTPTPPKAPPMPTTPPPIVTGSKVRSTRDHHLGTGVVCCVHTDYGQATVRFGSFPLPHLMQLADLRIVGEDPRPTRLSLAKAALEEARAKFDEHITLAEQWQVAHGKAKDELAAAESEAAQLAAIPPALLDVARHVVSCDPAKWNSIGVVDILARSHSVDPAVLRAAMGAKP